MIRKIFFFIALIFFIGGCDDAKVEVANSVDENQSIEMLVLFEDAGISAVREFDRKVNSKNSYRILVNKKDYHASIRVMHDLNLPRKREYEIEKLTSQSGFFPQSQSLLTLKYDRVKALKLERQIEALAGVLDARVAIYSPNIRDSKIREKVEEPRASVVIRHFPTKVDLPFSLSSIRQMVSLAVNNLPEEQVAIELVPVNFSKKKHSLKASKIWPFSFYIDKNDLKLAKKQIYMALFFIFVFGLFVGAMMGFIFLYKKLST